MTQALYAHMNNKRKRKKRKSQHLSATQKDAGQSSPKKFKPAHNQE
jgi:hypothetical protein